MSHLLIGVAGGGGRGGGGREATPSPSPDVPVQEGVEVLLVYPDGGGASAAALGVRVARDGGALGEVQQGDDHGRRRGQEECSA